MYVLYNYSTTTQMMAMHLIEKFTCEMTAFMPMVEKGHV
jgi:hypothetical protein